MSFEESSNEPLLQIDRRALLRGSISLGIAGAATHIFQPRTAFAKAPRRGGKFVAGIDSGSTTDSVDPVFLSSSATVFVSYQLGNRLVERTTDGQLGPELAERWEPTEGGKSWTFHLRDDVTFHNGKEFTAKDMVYSLNRHRGPDTKSGAASLMKAIEDIKVDNPHQFTVTLSAPDVNFPYLMANAALIAQSEGEDPAKGIGTGPFVLDSAQPGIRYNFRRNPKYFRPEPLFDELEILIINDDTARISALLAGSTHFASGLTPNLVERIRNSSSIKVDVADTTTFYYFVMQTNQAPFNNPDLRLALKYAVDRDLILKTTQAGYGTIGNDNPINSIYPLYSALPQHSYDPEKATFHYKKSGHSGAIDLYTSETVFPRAVSAVEIYQQSAAKAGITINPKRVPHDGYWSEIWMKKPFCASRFGSLATEDQAFTQPFASDSPWNDSNWYRPQFDKLLIQARSELDVGKRKSLYHDAAKMVQEDAGHITLMFSTSINGLAKNIHGFVGDHFHGEAKNFARCWFEA
ncbi:ABC transporter substrate-binding protein [Mesorhizobium sp. VK23B]|uniref:ABC transporter substrate-binding protein n=1 Tax=Mesorhizobium dulcispinae TaxID=3072316 RepID=A0ABU4XKW5_9HYPH|nr:MULTISPECIES: ABC transporter substrate-binding protein [unclassified Mesorhizobium]MDX8469068.1 ABC transporter substrate-binding protein [Mesorhizobium sp. VK23B]MDX8475392.1 ABC transporter substrate-binding protein [Mesorhizobium sp. VK23A]